MKLGLYENSKTRRYKQLSKLNRNELVDLVDKIMNCVGNDDEISNMIDIFKANIPHPGGSDLIFYPEKEPESAEEVVEIALSYKPIQL